MTMGEGGQRMMSNEYYGRQQHPRCECHECTQFRYMGGANTLSWVPPSPPQCSELLGFIGQITADGQIQWIPNSTNRERLTALSHMIASERERCVKIVEKWRDGLTVQTVDSAAIVCAEIMTRITAAIRDGE